MARKAKLISKLKKFDLFSSNVTFRENGSDTFGSVFGALTSIVIALIVSLYGLNKLIIMSSYDDSQFNEFAVKNALTDAAVGQDELDFQIAFSVVEIDWENQTFINDDFDKFIQYYVSIWSVDGVDVTLVEELSIHQCNKTDKALLFGNLQYVDTDEMDQEWTKFFCLDSPEKVQLRQGPQDANYTVLSLEAFYCKEGDRCRSSEEIQLWKQEQRMFLFYTNTKRYQPSLYGDRMVLEYADLLDYWDVEGKHLTYTLQQHLAQSDESFLGLGIVPKNTDSWFQQVTTKKPQVDTALPDTYFSVDFRLHKDVIHHERSIYTFFDLLGDVGGLFDALKGISSFLVALYFQAFGSPMDKHLLNAVFLKDSREHQEGINLKTKHDKLSYLSQRISYKYPRLFCLNFRSQKSRRTVQKGMQRIERELEADRFLKGQIQLRIALKMLFSKAERFLIRNNRRFKLSSESSETGREKMCSAHRERSIRDNDRLGERFEQLLQDTGLPRGQSFAYDMRQERISDHQLVQLKPTARVDFMRINTSRKVQGNFSSRQDSE